jgi:hypothetical protein
MSYASDDAPEPSSGDRGVGIVRDRDRFTEAKEGFKTSEFYVMAAS